MREEAHAVFSEEHATILRHALGSTVMSSSSTLEGHDLLRLFAPMGAVASGFLHAWGMALRKRYGEGSANYLAEPGWWAGAFADCLGGVAFTLSTPLLAVEILVPMTAVAQLAAAFVCGCCFFNERSTFMQQAGFVLSVVSVALLGATKQEKAEPLTSIEDFWHRWLQPQVLAVHCFWLCSTVLCFVGISEQNGFAVLSAYFDGVQFLFTRTIAAMLETTGSMDAALVRLSVFKAFCALTAIHWQQAALGADLTSIGTVLPLLQNLTEASLGAPFFGDRVKVTPALLAALAVAPLSVWLLAQTPERRRLSMLRARRA
ncbi:unnamed protein product, partial [Effrenium voratum]